jgi:hypothetical protein
MKYYKECPACGKRFLLPEQDWLQAKLTEAQAKVSYIQHRIEDETEHEGKQAIWDLGRATAKELDQEMMAEQNRGSDKIDPENYLS